MQAVPSHSGEMSQGSGMAKQHPSPVSGPLDPAARRTKRAFNALSASSIGLELGISVAIGLWFGWWLDGKLGSAPWMMLAFLLLGLVAGFRGVFRAVKRANAAADSDEEQAS
jgi:ATP synthase protein I